MIKSVFVWFWNLSITAGVALAGPYVNVETNAGWVGDDYSGRIHDRYPRKFTKAKSKAALYVQASLLLLSLLTAEKSLRLEFSLVRQVRGLPHLHCWSYGEGVFPPQRTTMTSVWVVNWV